MSWRPIGKVLPGRLTEARLELHWAAQLVSAPGATLLPATADFSHTNLGWDDALGVLAGRHVGQESLQAALVLESLELGVLQAQTERVSHALAGSTIGQALAWLGEQVAGSSDALALPAHDMPSHPVGDGASFSDAGASARAELAAWFANGAAALKEAVAEEPRASVVRCWPHHFDIASLVVLDATDGPEDARSIGLGFSPGDLSYDQPYFYVAPWPYPPEADLPALRRGGTWHTAGWTGVVLTAEALLRERADRRANVVQTVLAEAVEACHALLGA